MDMASKLFTFTFTFTYLLYARASDTKRNHTASFSVVSASDASNLCIEI